MNTPETKLTVETCNGAFSPDPSLSFNHANREVLRITHDGRMIKGEGLSWEEATQEAAKLLIASFKEQIQKMVDARLSDDTARLDWLQSSVNLHVNSIALRGDIRDAIDAAMTKEDGQ